MERRTNLKDLATAHPTAITMFLLSTHSVHPSTHQCQIIFQPHSCSEAALSLLECLEKLPCVTKDKRPMIECLKDEAESDGCRDVRYAYSMCKHSQLNMRTRIRGVRTY